MPHKRNPIQIFFYDFMVPLFTKDEKRTSVLFYTKCEKKEKMNEKI